MLPGPAEVRKGLGIDPQRRAETLEQEKCHFWRDRIPITRICSPGPLNPPGPGQPCFTGLPRKMRFSLDKQRRRGGKEAGGGAGRTGESSGWGRGQRSPPVALEGWTCQRGASGPLASRTHTEGRSIPGKQEEEGWGKFKVVGGRSQECLRPWGQLKFHISLSTNRGASEGAVHGSRHPTKQEFLKTPAYSE